MKQTDQNKLSMWKTVQTYLDANESVWENNKPFARAASSLHSAIISATAAILGQTSVSTGFSRKKQSSATEAVTLVTRIARSTSVFATETGNAPLKAAVSFPKSVLIHLSQATLAERLRSMVMAAESVAESLVEYGVTAGDYEQALLSIEAFEQAIPAPRAIITGRVAVTATVASIMKEGGDALTRMDNLVHIFEGVSPTFEAGYRAARVIVKSGSRHNNPSANAA